MNAEPPPFVLRLYVAGLACSALALFGGLVLFLPELGNVWVVVGLAIAAAFAERGGVWISSSVQMSIASVPMLFAAVLFGPLAGMLVGAATMLGDMRVQTDQPVLRWVTYASTRALTGGATGLTALAVAAQFENDFAAVAVATVSGALVDELLDTAFAAITLRLRGKSGLLAFFRGYGPLAVASSSIYAPIVAVLALAYLEMSPWTLALFAVPALAAQRLYVLYHGQRELTDGVLRANERLERANLSFATALVATLDARDHYTAGHSTSVAEYARDIAARMGLPVEEQRLAHLCGLVHDIGKVGLPAGLLEKRGPLTLRERRQMEQHSVIGERILAKLEEYSEIARVVRHHHERVDGQGYPDGLVGDEIPLLARIIAVADAYDAMTSDRPYRDAMPSRVARLRLAQAVESQFDTAVVAAFEAILASADETYRTGQRKDWSSDSVAAAPSDVQPVAVSP